MGDEEVGAAHVHLVRGPFHFRIGQVLAAGAEDFDHGEVVALAVDVADGAAELGHLPHAHRPLSGRKLLEDHVDAAHVGVFLELEHVAGVEVGLQVLPVVFEEVADGGHAVGATPSGDAAIHGAAPQLGLGVLIEVGRGDLLLAGKAELVSHQRLHPVAAALPDGWDEVGPKVAQGFGLVKKISLDRLAVIVLEVVVMGLVHGLDPPVDSFAVEAVDHPLVAALGSGSPPGKGHDLPVARGRIPAQAAVAHLRGQVDEAAAVNGVAKARDLAGNDGHEVFGDGEVDAAGAGVDGGGDEFAAGIFRREVAADFSARPPLLVEDPHGHAVGAGEVEADGQVAPPTRAQPVVMRAGLGGEGPVAALEDFLQLLLEPGLALVSVQPEERPGVMPGGDGQVAEGGFKCGWLIVAGVGVCKR